MREQEASRRSGVQLPAAICASTRRGKRERNGKGEGWTCGVEGNKPVGLGGGERAEL